MRPRASIWIGLTALVVASFGARSLSRTFVFRGAGATAAEHVDGFVHHTLVASDGVAVNAFELPAPSGARTVVYFHNNRETVHERASVARALRARGLGVMLVEYRGYGASRDGSPSEDGLYCDAEAALDMLAARGVGADRVVLWGTSLGTGVAAEMAKRGRGARLVLEAPYTSLPDLVDDVVAFVPSRVLLLDHFDTHSKASAIRVPTLVIHGDADEIVPFWMGERIAGAIRGARLVRVAGGKHSDLLGRDGERLLAAIAEHAS